MTHRKNPRSYSVSGGKRMSLATRQRIRHSVERNQGALTKHNYCLHCSTESRHRAINASIKSEGGGHAAALRTYRRLNLLETWNKQHPYHAAVARADKHYVERNYLKCADDGPAHHLDRQVQVGGQPLMTASC